MVADDGLEESLYCFRPTPDASEGNLRPKAAYISFKVWIRSDISISPPIDTEARLRTDVRSRNFKTGRRRRRYLRATAPLRESTALQPDASAVHCEVRCEALATSRPDRRLRHG